MGPKKVVYSIIFSPEDLAPRGGGSALRVAPCAVFGLGRWCSSFRISIVYKCWSHSGLPVSPLLLCVAHHSQEVRTRRLFPHDPSVPCFSRPPATSGVRAREVRMLGSRDTREVPCVPGRDSSIPRAEGRRKGDAIFCNFNFLTSEIGPPSKAAEF